MNYEQNLTFISTSIDKYDETKIYFESNLSFKLNLININNIHLNEIQGISEEILKDKLIQAAKLVQGPLIVEDSEFSLREMNDMSGP